MNKPLKLAPDTIFLGCPHLDHAKDFIWRPRGFESAEAHADSICRELTAYAQANPNATIVCLGDGFLNSTPERARAYFIRWGLPVLYLWGNHEGPTSQLVKTFGPTFDRVTFLGTEATFLVNKQLIFAHHFPFAIWDKSHHGVWHIHSHCHGSFAESLPSYFGVKRLDIGVDVCLKSFGKPYITVQQLKTIMDRKAVHKVDHHGADTN